MQAFVLEQGCFFHEGVSYTPGQEVWSEQPLDKLFPNKFKRTGPRPPLPVAMPGSPPARPVRDLTTITFVAFLWGVGIRHGGSSQEYVRRLYRGLCRHVSRPFSFVLFVDKHNEAIVVPHGVEKRPLKVPSFIGCLPKLYAHAPEAGLRGRVFIMDLDAIVVGSLDDMLAVDKPFVVRADEIKLKEGHLQSGGGFSFFIAGQYRHLWERWKASPRVFEQLSNVSDQSPGCERKIIQDLVPDKSYWQIECPGAMRHLNRDLNARNNGSPVPRDARILISSGALKPHRLPFGSIRARWERLDRTLTVHFLPQDQGKNQADALLTADAVALSAAGIKLSPRMDKADLLLMQAVRREDGRVEPVSLDRIAALGKPIVVLEKVDGCQVAPEHRPWLEDPAVVGWLKGYSYRNREVHNVASIDGRLHVSALCPGKATMPKVELTQAALDKIEPGWGFARYQLINRIRPLVSNWPNNRPVIATFRGKVGIAGRFPGAEALDAHRAALIERLKALGHDGAAVKVSLTEYAKSLLSAKVAVSPWGCGEACFRDYEAILAGCVVVKPRCPWVIGDPDIFNPLLDTVVFCEPDWSDLDKAIATAVERYEDLPRRQFARDLVLLEWDPTWHARRIARLLHYFTERAGV